MPSYSQRKYIRHPTQVSLPAEEVVRRYQAGEGLYALEIASGMSGGALRQILTAAGVEIRKRGGVKGSSYLGFKFTAHGKQPRVSS